MMLLNDPWLRNSTATVCRDWSERLECLSSDEEKGLTKRIILPDHPMIVLLLQQISQHGCWDAIELQ